VFNQPRRQRRRHHGRLLRLLHYAVALFLGQGRLYRL
jgi:hypothetical protein